MGVFSGGAHGKIYLKETGQNITNISNAGVGTELGTVKDISFTYNNHLERYIECDSNIESRQGPTEITGTINQLMGNGQMYAIVVGAETAPGVVTVSKPTHLPTFEMYIQIQENVNHYAYIKFSNVRLDRYNISVRGGQLIMENVTFTAEDITTTTYKGLT